jgi:hypothetical protein
MIRNTMTILNMKKIMVRMVDDKIISKRKEEEI